MSKQFANAITQNRCHQAFFNYIHHHQLLFNNKEAKQQDMSATRKKKQVFISILKHQLYDSFLQKKSRGQFYLQDLEISFQNKKLRSSGTAILKLWSYQMQKIILHTKYKTVLSYIVICWEKLDTYSFPMLSHCMEYIQERSTR